MPSKILLLCLLTIIVASSVYAQQPHWYVLLEPGNERYYRSEIPQEHHELVTGYEDGSSVVEVTHYYHDEFDYTSTEYWRIDDGGDVWGEIWGEEKCYIDMPLVVGKSWGTTWGQWDQYYDIFTIMGFEHRWGAYCVVIREEIYDGDERTMHRWYSDGIGLLHIQWSCAFCHWWLEPLVVGVESRSWSSVKGLFRD